MTESVRERVLAAVRNQDIGWRRHGTTTRIHWWLSEDEKRRLTPAERQVLHEFIAERTVMAERNLSRSDRGAFAINPAKGRP